MSEQTFGPIRRDAGRAEDDAILIESPLQVTAPALNGQGSGEADSWPADTASGDSEEVDIEEARTLALMAREQLARDYADIESATAALRRAEPALQSWSRDTVPAAAKPQPLWLVIGALWLSTVIVTVGAVVAIASLAS
jgi:hypothetical protein